MSDNLNQRTSMDILIDNDREWRRYTLEKIIELDKKLDARIIGLDNKIDSIDKELSTFKVKVFSIASIIGGAAGVSVDWVLSLLKGH